MDSKEDVFFEICNAVLKLEVQKGHLCWKISDVARVSGVTRSLIYYYFGKEKEVILSEAWKFMLQLFFENSGDQPESGIINRMQNILKYVEKMPYLMVLFYLEKGKDTEFAQQIRKCEESLFEKLAIEYPQKTKNEIEQIYMMELGSIIFKLAPNRVDEVFQPIIG